MKNLTRDFDLSFRREMRLAVLTDAIEACDADKAYLWLGTLLDNHWKDPQIVGPLEKALEESEKVCPIMAHKLHIMVASMVPENETLRRCTQGYYDDYLYKKLDGLDERQAIEILKAELKAAPENTIMRSEAVKAANTYTLFRQNNDGLTVAARYTSALAGYAQPGSYQEKHLLAQWVDILERMPVESQRASLSIEMQCGKPDSMIAQEAGRRFSQMPAMDLPWCRQSGTGPKNPELA